jgi:hypothetical protein
MPYHIQETLFLFSINGNRLAVAQPPVVQQFSAVPTEVSTSTSSAMFGVDRQCNPVDPSCNMAIDAEATFKLGLTEIRRVLRGSAVSLEPGVPRGLLEYKTLVEHGKLFWLLKRLTSMKQSSHRVPSAGAGGVRTTVLLERPASETFTMVDRFLGDAYSASNAPSVSTVETSRATFTIEAAQYEPKFTPVEGGGEGGADDGLQDVNHATPNRFLLTLTITPKNAAFHHALVVNSQMFCVDVPTQVLFEEVGTFVSVARLPLFARSEELRTRAERNEGDSVADLSHNGSVAQRDARVAAAGAWFARSRSASLGKKGDPRYAAVGEVPSTATEDSTSQLESIAAPKWPAETYSTTMQLISDNGPGLIKGVLYVKEMVEHADITEEHLVPTLARTPVTAVPFGPIALRCTL